MLLELATHDPSGSGYASTLEVEDSRIHEGEPPYREVKCLTITVGSGRKTETAFLSDEHVAQLRGALDRYLATRRQSS